MNKKTHYVYLIGVFVLFALFASIFTLQKATLLYSEKFFLVGSRMFAAGVVLLFYTIIKYKNLYINKEHITLLISLTLYNIYLTNILEIWGLSQIQSTKTCMIYSLSPFISAIIGYYTLKETLNRNKIIGLSIGLIAVLLNTEKIPTIGKTHLNYAELSVLLAVLTSVYGWCLLKKLLEYGYSPLLLNGISMFIGGSLILIHSYIVGEKWEPIPVSNILIFTKLTCVTCIISNIICYNLFGFLLKKFSITFMNFAGLTTPLFASIFGYIYLHEVITIWYYTSLTILVIGLIIFYKEEKIRSAI
jgi:drug/metabolite transporter (DMT)-like permease